MEKGVMPDATPMRCRASKRLVRDYSTIDFFKVLKWVFVEIGI
jgi:hypothetical protein